MKWLNGTIKGLLGPLKLGKHNWWELESVEERKDTVQAPKDTGKS